MHLNAATLAALLLPLASAKPACHPACSPKPPAFILAGDSTTAVQAAGGGGWGNGFLSFVRAPPAWGVNKGHNGATTVSFVKGGDWANVTRLIDEKNAEGYQVWVTVQFGHNDQKPDKNISLPQYTTNLINLARSVREHGGHPLLLTPLTRRGFPTDSPHNLTDNLFNERQHTIAAAKQSKTPYLDLNAASKKYVNKIGSDAAHAYDLKKGDSTHLNDWGSVVFGRMVADLLLESESGKCLGPWIQPNATLSKAIREGVPA
ncbi:SGNH hydrolase-type esterase domain-containing protein [Apiospora arundinis]|uniref:SGNH hydrolase-type esterase domain-containing protein n=1 Tax=Apiospora arundinis TaxID=335852 RepID=A0ABR2I388_9PEZI